MKFFLHIAVIVCLGCMLFFSCNNSPDRLEPFKWPVISSSLDSLTLQAEFLWLRMESLDSINTVIDEMERIAQHTDGEKRNDALARAHYWKGRLLKRERRLSDMERELHLALQLCDSTRDPYTYGRIQELLYLSSNSKSEKFFKFLLSRLEYYKEIGDLTQEANIAVNIYSCLNAPIEPFMMLDYLKLADSLYTLLGFQQYELKNRINEASLMFNIGREDEAKNILDSLLVNPIIINDKNSLELVLRNHHSFFGDSLSLFKAYELACTPNNSGIASHYSTITPEEVNIKALYEALICEHYLKTGRLDSASHYRTLSEFHLAELHDRHIRAGIFEIFSGYYESTGDSAKALRFLKRAISLSDSLEFEDQPHRKVYLENINTLRIKEIEAENTHRRLKLIHYLIIAVMLIVLAVIVILFQHLRQIQKMKEVQTQLELERGQRKLMALSLSKEESNKILDYIKKEVTRISRDDNLSSSEVSQIERNLKLHLAGQGEMESFERTFENVNPDFVKKIKTICPGISENHIRLCSYILIGLSNRQIADLMNVRPGSVKQSRWRLRSKLGLSTEDSLEDYLRRLAE